MRKSLQILMMLAIAFVIASCGSPTYVRTKTLTPADIDMSSMMSVAIASTDQYAGSLGTSIRFTGSGSTFAITPYSYSSTIHVDLSKHFNEKFINDIQSIGYFKKVIVPPDSDMLAKPGAGESLGLSRAQLAKKNGIDALINTSVTKMTVDEYVETNPYYEYKKTKDSSGKSKTTKTLVRYDYTLHQSVYMEVELKIVDAITGKVYNVKKGSDSYSTSKSISYGLGRSDSLESKFNEMLDNISIKLVNTMIPHYTYRDVEMMENKPNLSTVNVAYDYVRSGQYNQALELFRAGWQINNHIPSGYNAALLLHALGEIDEAVELAESVNNSNELGVPEILPLLGNLKAMQALERKAKVQLVDNSATYEEEEELPDLTGKVMENKPFRTYLDPAYEYVRNGEFPQALELFKYGWEKEKHLASGYNAALILGAQNKIDDAIKLAEEIKAETDSPEILPLLGELKDKAEKQGKK